MALLKDTKYIKLEPDGKVSIYISAEARQRQKIATPSTKIILKYNEILGGYQKQLDDYINSLGLNLEIIQLDRVLYDKLLEDTKLLQILKSLEDISTELYYYESDLSVNKGAQHEFPIMKKYFPDIEDSIPFLLEGCYVCWDTVNIDEIYNFVKETKFFGETEDC